MIHDATFSVNSKGRLSIAGFDAVELAERYGTPVYLLDIDAVRENCRIYRNAMNEHFGGGSRAFYASKALSYKGIYRVAAEEGLCVDCVSPGELATAKAAGFPMENVCFHGNNKTDEDLKYALSLHVGRFACDCAEELAALDTIAGNAGVMPRVILRVTPGIDPHTHKKITTGNVDSKFGTPIGTGQAEELVKLALGCRNIELVGLHCHIGSQIFDVVPFSAAAEIMLAFIARLKTTFGWVARELSLGGGFGVRYTEHDPKIDIAENIRLLSIKIRTVCETYGIEQPDIMLEPGRSIVAAAGATLYTVGSVKTIPGFRSYVSVDGGMPDNPRYALYGSEYTFVNATHAASPADFVCTISGRCCESGDLLGENVKIAKPQRGDILAVLVTGAYNYSMASNYNRIPRPPLIELEGGRARIGIARESYEDLYRLDV